MNHLRCSAKTANGRQCPNHHGNVRVREFNGKKYNVCGTHKTNYFFPFPGTEIVEPKTEKGIVTVKITGTIERKINSVDTVGELIDDAIKESGLSAVSKIEVEGINNA